ncbi:MAG: (Fe-S)-binding protein [Deltaproteobacteria bacterium]|nr:(Fe-S)-binding protein [Deltaproteobacteria bacterium]
MPNQVNLPGIDCGLCGSRTCAEFAQRLATDPELIKRCIPLSTDSTPPPKASVPVQAPAACEAACAGCAPAPRQKKTPEWHDSLGREFDFILEHFPEDPGPREIILPHNPMLTREMDVKRGDVLIGRPLGMSCGCPITHCGVVSDVDPRTGVITWCVTGPLGPREKGFKDIGYYIAEAYEGMIPRARCDIKIGMRYFFQPRMCMLQWRHSGLVNYVNRTPVGMQVRLEGLWIG